MATKFTKQTQFTDHSLVYDYEDMRGHHWVVKVKGGPPNQWVAYPSAAAAAAYELTPDRLWAAATDAEMLIDGIEERIEAARAAGQSPGVWSGQVKSSGFPWWLALVAAVAYYSKRRR